MPTDRGRHMKTNAGLSVVFAGLLLIAQAGAEGTNTAATLKVAFGLADGSRVLGEPVFKEIPLQTSFGAMQIPLQKIRGVTFGADHKSIELALGNGDRLTGSSSADNFKLKTLFGAVSIPAAIIKTMSVSITGGVGNVQDGLVLWFSFKRAQNETIPDESGHNNNGRLFKGAKIVEDEQRGSALELDGETAHIRVPGSPDFAMTNATIAAWVRPDSWVTRQNEPLVILSPLSPQGCQGGLELDLAMDRLICWAFRSATASEGTDASSGLEATEDGRWHQVTITFEYAVGAYHSCCYLDAQKIKTDDRAYKPMSYGGQVMYIGINYDSPAAALGRDCFRQFKGRIGDIKVFNRALSAEEVAALFANGK